MIRIQPVTPPDSVFLIQLLHVQVNKKLSYHDTFVQMQWRG